VKAPANLNIVLQLLKRYYPDAHCALIHKNAFELLVATILSAQCTDDRVNQVTPSLFAQYPTPQKMAAAPLEDLELSLRSVNFYKNKSKNLKACAQSLVDRHLAEVPEKLEELIALAGVGRKTANVVLGNAFQIPSGIVVDTHVARLSFRLGWVKVKDPVLIEKQLGSFVPEKNWIQLPHELIFHGRQICKARTPLCERCFLLEHCPQKGV
jgi:endonuclease-3